MLSDVLREKTDKWIARKRKEGMDKARAEGVVEGRAEGLAEGESKMMDLWLDWNRRPMEHEAKGEPFNEPPPSRDP